MRTRLLERCNILTSLIALILAAPAAFAQYTISTISGFLPDASVARDVDFLPRGTAVDSQGTLFILLDKRILQLTPDGHLLHIVGTGRFSSVLEGPAREVSIQIADQGASFGPAGELYIVDNLLIRKFDPLNGSMTTVAGGGQAVNAEGIPAKNASLNGPRSVVVDAQGNLYFCEIGRHVIRRVDASTGILTTIAGTGTPGYAGDGGPAKAAQFNSPVALALDDQGNLYVADSSNYRIRKIAAGTGIISTVVGRGIAGSSGDGGLGTAATISIINSLFIDRSGNLFFSAPGRIRKMRLSDNSVSLVAGNGTIVISDGPAASTGLHAPTGLSADSTGNLYFVDDLQVREVNAATQSVQTIAGGGSGGDGGPASNAQFIWPWGISVDAQDNVYAVDTISNRIRRIDSQGIITTIAAAESPRRVAFDGAGNIYFTATQSIRMISAATGQITTVVGGNGSGIPNEGDVAAGSVLQTPLALAVDSAGTIYFSQQAIVFKVVSGRIVRVAGNVQTGQSGDGGDARDALLASQCSDLVLDAKGNLYISASGIRKVDAGTGIITTTVAPFFISGSMAITPSGNLFLQSNVGILYFDAQSGLTRQIAGSSQGFAGDGGPARLALFGQIAGLAVDSKGRVFVADVLNSAIRLLTPDPIVVSAVTNGASNQSGPIAPGEVAVLYGSGLGDPFLTRYRVDTNGRMATELSGTRVLFQGISAPILYTSANQVGVIVPYGVTGSTADVVVEYQGARSPAQSVAVAASAPALFTSSATGIGQAAALQDVSVLNSSTRPIAIGGVISLFGTGEGATSAPGVDGKFASNPAPTPLLAVTATVGGLPARVLYAGGSPGQIAGLLQVNVEIPSGVAPGPSVPVFIQVGARSSQAGVTITVK